MLGALRARLDDVYFKGQLVRDEGQALVEYALIIALVSIAALTTLGLLGGKVDTFLGAVKDAI